GRTCRVVRRRHGLRIRIERCRLYAASIAAWRLSINIEHRTDMVFGLRVCKFSIYAQPEQGRGISTGWFPRNRRHSVIVARPSMISVPAASFHSGKGSPNQTAALAMPTTGTSSDNGEIVAAG